jgi:hypothetical protein
MIRHARLTLQDQELDELHALKRRLGRERGRRMNLDELLHEGVGLVLRYYTLDAEVITGGTYSDAARAE